MAEQSLPPSWIRWVATNNPVTRAAQAAARLRSPTPTGACRLPRRPARAPVARRCGLPHPGLQQLPALDL